MQNELGSNIAGRIAISTAEQITPRCSSTGNLRAERMYIPRTRENVELLGKPGKFFVLSVDPKFQIADLVLLSDYPRLEENVPFADISPAAGNEDAMHTEDAENLT